MRRAVISGATGFLGKELARQLAADGIEVHGLTRQPSVAATPFPDLRFHLIDDSTECVIAAISAVQPDVVFHLAALARRDHLASDIVPFVDANLRFGTQLLESMRTCGCRHFVTAGSYLQYSDTGLRRPLNLYAATKNAFEQILEFYVDAYGIGAAHVALCNIYGEDDPRPQLITEIAVAYRTGTPIVLHAPESWVDLVHVEDAARAFVGAAYLLQKAAEPGLRRFSVSCGRDVSSTELISLFERIGNRRLVVQRPPLEKASRRTRPWRNTSMPEWEPRVTLEDGIRRLI